VIIIFPVRIKVEFVFYTDENIPLEVGYRLLKTTSYLAGRNNIPLPYKQKAINIIKLTVIQKFIAIIWSKRMRDSYLL
jgi:hypothetical protein